jgi:hypothetical protein
VLGFARQDEDGDVVSRRLVADQPAHDGRAHRLGRARHDGGGQPGEPGVEWLTPALHQAVRVEHEVRPGRQRYDRVPTPARPRQPDGRIRGYLHQIARHPRQGEDGRRVPGRGHRHLDVPRLRHRAEHGGHDVVLEVLHLPVQPSQQFRGILGQERVGAHGAA